jgi:hypothetical protein
LEGEELQEFLRKQREEIERKQMEEAMVERKKRILEGDDESDLVHCKEQYFIRLAIILHNTLAFDYAYCLI